MRQLTDYEVGYVSGLAAYAWWKDGWRYVGTTGTTFSQAVCVFLAECGGFTPEDAAYLARQA